MTEDRPVPLDDEPREFLHLWTDGEVFLRFECRPSDTHELPDGSVMFYNATITEFEREPSAVGQKRDIFKVAGGGVQFNAAKGIG